MRTLLNRSSWDEQANQRACPQVTNNPAAARELWLAVNLPDLALECSGQDYQDLAFVVLEDIAGIPYVHSASSLAQRQGISAGMAVNAALALCDNLQSCILDPLRQQEKLQELATDALQLSPRVSITPPTSFLLEVAGSISYFGSLETIQQKISGSLKKKLKSSFNMVVSPVPAASLLLASAGYETVIRDLEELRSVSGDLPVSALPIDDKSLSKLGKIGVRVLRDIWRLPVSELARRFDADFINYLDTLLGKRQELLPLHQPSPYFQKQLLFPAEINQNHLLLPYLDSLLHDLVIFLRHFDLYTNSFLFHLSHRQHSPSTIHCHLRQATRDHEHFLKLVETDLQQRQLPAPVMGLELLADEFHEFQAKTRELFRHSAGSTDDKEDIEGLLDQLRVRLGQDQVSNLAYCADHRPEYAGFLSQQVPGTSPLPGKNRPLWLLPKPRLLRIKTNRLYYSGPVHIYSGPERIEAGWWDGNDIRRDYYIAVDKVAGRLWIYRDLKQSNSWYLHGLFG